MLASPRFVRHEFGGAGAHRFVENEFARGEDQNFVDISFTSLVVHREGGEAVDFIAPQVDADRRVGRRRKDVDDRASLGDFTAVLHEVLASVTRFHELLHEGGRIDHRTLGDHDRLDPGGVRTELLEEGAHARHDHLGHSFGVTDPPQDFEPSTHRLDTRTHSFERKGFPGREQRDRIDRHQDAQIVGDLTGHGSGGAGDHEWPASGDLAERGQAYRAAGFGNGHDTVGRTEQRHERTFVAQTSGQRCENASVHRELNVFIAASTP